MKPTAFREHQILEKANGYEDMIGQKCGHLLIEADTTGNSCQSWCSSAFAIAWDNIGLPLVVESTLSSWCRYMGRQASLHYVARDKVKGVAHHAKAGNINSALLKEGSGLGDYILVLDSDMLVHPDFLLRSLGHFYEKKGPAKAEVILLRFCCSCCKIASWCYVHAHTFPSLHESCRLDHLLS